MALAFPNVWPESVDVIPVRAQVATISPSSFHTQVQDRGGEQYRITINMGDMNRDEATLMCAFIHALNGMSGTFDFDLDPWCPGVSPAPGTREFRLASPDIGWGSRGSVVFTLQFAAMEVVSS
jgi:hypothetical protein